MVSSVAKTSIELLMSTRCPGHECVRRDNEKRHLCVTAIDSWAELCFARHEIGYQIFTIYKIHRILGSRTMVFENYINVQHYADTSTSIRSVSLKGLYHVGCSDLGNKRVVVGMSN